MSLAQLDDILAPVADRPRVPFSIDGVRRDWFAESDDIPAQLTARREQLRGFEIEWLRRPDARRDRAILYLHGGGYVCGSIRTHRALTNALAQIFDGTVVGVDYRLAPEAPFPSAVDDAAMAFREVVATGCPASGIAVAGDSAGGGLAIATALKLRELGHALPGALWAISPWADLTNKAGTLDTLAHRDPFVFKESLVECARHYLAGHDAGDPLASPVLGDLAGLPPILIQVGAREILLDDALALARAAGVANVEATLEVWADMVHVWHLFEPNLDEAGAAIRQASAWLTSRLK